MTEVAESGPTKARNLLKEAWIKLAADKDIIHALRTLSNEDVRNALVNDGEWKQFVSLVSGAVEDRVLSRPKNGSVNAANIIQTSFLIHFSIWFVFVSLALSAWVWWLGQRRGWWGRGKCHKCLSESTRKSRRCPEEDIDLNISKEFGSVEESNYSEPCDCSSCRFQLNSHSVEECVSAACHNSQQSRTTQNAMVDEDSSAMMDDSEKTFNFKMCFLVAMIICLCLSALICAFQIINLEERYLALSGYAIKSRSNLNPPRVSPVFDEFVEVEEPLEQQEDCKDFPETDDPIVYPARLVTEIEKPKNQVLRKSSQTKKKRSNRSKNSKKHSTANPSRSHDSKTSKNLETSGTSSMEKENDTAQSSSNKSKDRQKL